MATERAIKRRRLSSSDEFYLKTDEVSTMDDHLNVTKSHEETTDNVFGILTRPISPPFVRRKHEVDPTEIEYSKTAVANTQTADSGRNVSELISVSSPIQLSHVEGLSAVNNIDTVSLRDILGDPLIKECWVLNYLFDLDFLM